MRNPATSRPISILLVEDDPDDAGVTLTALEKSKMNNEVTIVPDGATALDSLYRRGRFADAGHPDLILLDLDLPGRAAYKILADVKAHPDLKSVPIIVLASSAGDPDIARCYAAHANCCVAKPADVARFAEVILGISDFWLTIVRLPPNAATRARPKNTRKE